MLYLISTKIHFKLCYVSGQTVSEMVNWQSMLVFNLFLKSNQNPLKICCVKHVHCAITTKSKCNSALSTVKFIYKFSLSTATAVFTYSIATSPNPILH